VSTYQLLLTSIHGINFLSIIIIIVLTMCLLLVQLLLMEMHERFGE